MSSGLFSGKAVGISTYAPPDATSTRRLLEGSTQQEDIWATLLGEDSHLIVEARAGTGKSSTAREGIHRLIEADRSLAGRVSYLAYNKSIADEFKGGLPPGATATTMHSAGYAALRAALPGLGAPNRHKLRGIADRLLPRRDMLSRKAKTAAIGLAEFCKGRLIGADVKSQRYGIEPNVLRRIAIAQGIDLRGFEATALGLVPELLKLAIKEVASIDFGDMVWLPVMLELDFAPCEVLFIDEAQDLDPCQHALVARIVGDGRMAVIGDPRQAIYLFRGADCRSMETLGSILEGTARGVERLPLTATRRCPTSHVELARNIVPDFESLPGAPGGRWEQDVEASDVVEPGWMVLSRKNAPMLSLAFRTAARGIPVAVQGKDLGEGLARFIEDFEAATVAGLLLDVARYRAAELAKLSDLDDVEEEVALVNDRCDCIGAAAERCASPGQVAANIRKLFQDVGKAEQGSYVLFSSVHRAKGRESDRVAILDPLAMPSPWAKTDEAREQELNLLYVAATRSKHRLSFLGPLPEPFKGA